MYSETVFKNVKGAMVVVHRVSFNNGDAMEFFRSKFGGAIIKVYKDGFIVDRLRGTIKEMWVRFCQAKTKKSIYV